MTGRELLNALQALSDEELDSYQIETEGCDCFGDVAAVEADSAMCTIYLLRAKEDYIPIPNQVTNQPKFYLP